ncbi:MAG: TIGR04255 family protein [Cyanobacteria bacterium]|nr:TIGR04255 family protein [Cyanobacteriota bacterium]
MSKSRAKSSKQRQVPLQEAIIEVRFSQDGWDVTSADRFPDKRDVQPITLIFGQTAGSIPPVAPIVQLWSKNQTSLVQFGPGIIAVNTLRYKSWSQFLPVLREIVNPYIEVVNPSKLVQIRTRFVNRFDFTKDEVDLAEFFTCSINLPEPLQEINSFQLSISSTVGPQECPHSFTVEFGIDPTAQEPGNTSVILDMDCSCTPDGKPTLAVVEKTADELHTSIKGLFASFVRPALRTEYGL